METLRLGWAGLGPRGRDLITNALHVPGARITAVCDREPGALERGRAAVTTGGSGAAPAAFTDFRRLLDSDVDAVVIATDVAQHAPMAIQALRAGKHVLSEVPAITSAADAAGLRAAVAASGKTFMLGENVCFWSFVEEWREWYRAGRIGQAFYAEAEYLHNVVHLMRDAEGRPTWRSRLNAIQYLTHDLGPLLWILGDRCVSASGFAPAFNPIPEHSTAAPNEVAIFRTEKGALIKVLAAFGLEREPAVHNFCLYGSAGTLETTRDGSYQTNAWIKGPTGHPSSETIYTALSSPASGVPPALLESHGGADFLMLAHFVRSVLDGTLPRVDIDLAIDMSLPGIYAQASHEQGGIPLEIPRDSPLELPRSPA
jgi:predicted dehydrogenase